VRKGDKDAAARRRFPIGVDPRRERRQEQAAARQAEYDKLTNEQKVERALARPGNSARELTRLGES